MIRCGGEGVGSGRIISGVFVFEWLRRSSASDERNEPVVTLSTIRHKTPSPNCICSSQSEWKYTRSFENREGESQEYVEYVEMYVGGALRGYVDGRRMSRISDGRWERVSDLEQESGSFEDL